MRSWKGVRGASLLELIAASAIATVLGGGILLLMNSMRAAYQTHTTFNQLSGYLDVATTVLRRDIWGATTSTQSGTGACPSDWLRLENPSQPATYPIAYCLDTTTDPNNVTLRRTVNGGAAWNVAQFVLQGANTSAVIDNPLDPRLITINLQLSRTVNERQYLRQVSGVVHRMQTQ